MKSPLLPAIAITMFFSSAVFADERSDRQIEQAVNSSYVFQRVLNNAIDVKVQNGVAILAGSVRDVDQSRLAEDTVAGFEGVHSVRNLIKIDPAARESSDDWLAVKIRSRLLLKPDVSMTTTRVHVKEGVVMLTGTADSPAQKQRTEAYIREVMGVREVRNELEIVPGAGGGSGVGHGAGQPTGRENVGAQDREALGQKIDDATLAAQIKFELLTRRVANALKTDIDSDNGRVVISGEVPSQADKDVITEVAQGVSGVKAVENRMTVKEK
jgi:hyperosmotically inducible periplasmic protein